MRTFLLHKTKQQTDSPFAIRRRIKSMQTKIKREFDDMPEEEMIMRRLERGLEKEMDREEELLAEPSTLLPETQIVRIENKLWKYFVGRMEQVGDKVQKEKLNICERELLAIKEQIIKRRTSNKDQIIHLQAKIQARHIQIHALFQQIKHEKLALENIANLMKARKKRQQETVQNNSPDKILKIKEKIENIRAQIGKAEQDVQHHKTELFKIQEEWKSFLRHFLKEGYYFQDGVSNILKEMIQIDYTPIKADFPSFLDETSKRCLISEHLRLKAQASKQPKKNHFVKSEQVTESKRNMRMLIKKDNLQSIYDSTKNYMMDWLRNQGWKQEINLPRIQSTKTTTEKCDPDWRVEERKRLVFIDDKERYNKVRAVLFGSKVQTLL